MQPGRFGIDLIGARKIDVWFPHCAPADLMIVLGTTRLDVVDFQPNESCH